MELLLQNGRLKFPMFSLQGGGIYPFGGFNRQTVMLNREDIDEHILR